ncbi:MAG TPA: hypothetical protein DDZ84_02285 [Firmicutes bacterium]|jgi:spore coat protein U-like protein|nr:hypothetical protein [Bacillota bacterium]
MPRFIGKPAEVECSAGSTTPTAFAWNDTEMQVVKIVAEWQDFGFGGAHPIARTWRTRRHRNYYRILCSDGHTYEIYLDRGSGRREWHVYRQVD